MLTHSIHRRWIRAARVALLPSCTNVVISLAALLALTASAALAAPDSSIDRVRVPAPRMGLTWTIQATAGACVIAPEGTVVVQDGTDMPFAISADACHAISDVVVDGTSMGPVTTYTFTNVHENHAIDVTCTSLMVGTSTSIGATPSPSVCGGAVTLTANVSPGSATGDVEFFDGVTSLGTAPVSGGVATLSVAAGLAAGDHTLNATFTASGCFDPSSAPGFAQSVARAPASVVLTTDVNPSSWDQPVTFTATVTPATATGTVTFNDSLAVLGTAPVIGGVATLVRASLAAGAHTSMTAHYSGDACLLSAASAPHAQSVGRAASTTLLASDLNPAACGAVIKLTAAITPAGGTGRATFYNAGSVIGTATVNALTGLAVLNVGNLLPGAHALTVSYPGDRNVAPSVSTPLSQVVGASASTVVLGSDINPSTWPQAATFVATVTPGSASGTVTFRDSLQVIGTTPVVDGVAVLVKSGLIAGAHTRLTAVYSGDLCVSGSTSAPYSQLVSTAPSTISLAADVSPSACGDVVKLTATLVPAGGTGRATFYDAGNAIGTATVNAVTGLATLNVGNLLPGTHPLTLSYPGDHNVASCVTAAPYNQVVGAAPATLALTSDVNPSTWSQAVTFTATMTPASATGTITFKDSLTVIGSAPVVDGVATLVKPNLCAGAHTAMTAVYAGDLCTSAATSTPYAQRVVRAPGTVALTSDGSPSVCGAPVTLTATLSPAGGTGRMTFYDDGTVIGTATVSALTGLATLNVGNLLPGTHPLTVSYPGDRNVTACATASPLDQVTGAAATAVALASDVNPSTWSQAVTFTATVTPAAATGTITFRDSLAVIGSAPIVDGVATLVKSNLVTGAHTAMTAVYAGDLCSSNATSASYSQRIMRSPSTVVLASDGTPSVCNQPIRLTATLSPAGGTGRMTFYDAGSAMGTANVNALTGIATLYVGNLLTGTHALTVSYPGDKNVASCVTAAALSQAVGTGPATIVLTSDSNPSMWAQAVTLSASMTPPTASGTVTFWDSLQAIGSAPINGGVAQLIKSNFATGLHTRITAVYAGDGCAGPATSAPLAQAVDRASGSISLSTDANPAPVGQPVKVTATVTPSGGTGRVRFYSDGNPIGTATVSALTGLATLSVDNLLSGTHDLTASYPGDHNVGPCGSAAPYSQVITGLASSVVLTSDVNPSVLNQKVTLIATVTPAGATGLVEFFDGASALGTAPVETDGTAILSITTLATGDHTLTATYGGNPAYTASTSEPLIQTVADVPAPLVTVTYPNGGENISVSTKINLRWSVTGGTGVASVSLEVSRDRCATWETIVWGIPNSGSYVWTVPAPGTNEDASPEFTAWFRVTAEDYNGYNGTDTSDSPFSLFDAQTAAVITELAAETLDEGVSLKWAFAKRVPFERLELQRSVAEIGPWASVTAAMHEEGDATVAVDRSAEPGQTYFYRLVGTISGAQAVFGPVKGTAGAPREFALSAVWPNPTRGPLSLRFAVARQSNVRLSVLDLQGREVAVLTEGAYHAGRYQADWDGHTARGLAPAGLYFVRFLTPDQNFTHRVVLAR